MKIAFHDSGAISVMTITSSVFEFRRHCRVIDTVCLNTPGVVFRSTGFFRLKTLVSGKSRDMLRAHKTAQREAAR